jgi:hypothetical protein
MRSSLPLNVAESSGLGGCDTGALTGGQALAVEFFTCMFMLIPTYGTAFNEKQRDAYGLLVPFIIGGALFVMLYAISAIGAPPFTPGGFPNMCLGIGLAKNTFMPAEEAFKKPWVYWVGSLLALTVNGILYGVAPPFHDQPVEENNPLLKKK